jgi:tRNA nucleotidyltransferase (CCA-adding enzyme)
MNRSPEKIRRLAESVAAAGGRAMLVGGCVRDELLGIEPKDWDLEVFGVEPEKLRSIIAACGAVNTVGESFTVYKVGRDLDVSLPRRERKTGRGHRGFIVEGDKDMTFAEAAKRRDFTVNAIMKDALTGEFVDCFDGRGDLARRVLRMVSAETFEEDSLRVLRAAQFAARFEFEIDPATADLCRSIALDDLARERVWGELEKLVLKANRPSIGLRQMYELEITRKLFPEIEALRGVPQEPEWHPEGDVDVHTLMVVDEARKLIEDLDYPRQVTVMLAALFHDLGKPATTEFFDGRWRSHGHDEAGIEPTLAVLDRLGMFTLDGYDVRTQVVELVRLHLYPGMFFKSRPGDGAFRRIARRVEPDLLYRVAKADSLGRNPEWLAPEKRFGSEAQEWFIERIRAIKVERRAPEPILLGRHLIEMNLKPSPLFKRVLDAVYERQLDGSVADLEDAIAVACELIGETE